MMYFVRQLICRKASRQVEEETTMSAINAVTDLTREDLWQMPGATVESGPM